jgi:hypothetical protein
MNQAEFIPLQAGLHPENYDNKYHNFTPQLQFNF